MREAIVRKYEFRPDRYAPRPRMRGVTLPQKCADVLAFVKQRIAAEGRFPSTEAIRRHMGWNSRATARGVLSRLAMHGYLERDEEEGCEELGRPTAWKLKGPQ